MEPPVQQSIDLGSLAVPSPVPQDSALPSGDVRESAARPGRPLGSRKRKPEPEDAAGDFVAAV